MKIYFLSFYTDGQDDTYDLSKIIYEVKDKLQLFFDDIFIFNKKDLKNLSNSENICNVFSEELDMNPNANKIGYFDFKPFLIKNILTKIPKDSILIYHDGNFIKNSQYWQTDWSQIKNICNLLLSENKSDIFCQFEREGLLVREMVKTYTIDKIFPDYCENKIIKNCLLINAARIIMKNTKFTEYFIDDYLNLCLQKDLLSKNPNPIPDTQFKWSCGDQDVLNCLIYRYILDGKLQSSFPIYTFLYRVMRFDKHPFIWEGQSWNPHPSGYQKLYNYELIEYLNKKKLTINETK